jgi:hypothetical protein
MSRPQARPRGRLGRARRGLRAGLTTEVRPGHSQEFAKPGIDDAGGRSALRISRQLESHRKFPDSRFRVLHSNRTPISRVGNDPESDPERSGEALMIADPALEKPSQDGRD